MKFHKPRKPPRWLRRRIKRCIRYYPKSGKLIWIAKPTKKSYTIKIGGIVGSIKGGGYLTVGLTRKNRTIQIACHHICWYLYYGEWPKQEIDHRDTNGLNNRIKNLRLATRSKNNSNKNLQKNNVTGVAGVSFHGERYRARISIKRKTLSLGVFSTLKEARKVRRMAEKKYFGKFRPKLTKRAVINAAIL